MVSISSPFWNLLLSMVPLMPLDPTYHPNLTLGPGGGGGGGGEEFLSIISRNHTLIHKKK